MTTNLYNQAVSILADAFYSMDLTFDIERIRSMDRDEETMSRRRLACLLLRDAGFTLCQIAHVLNRKQHGSVLNMLNQPGWADLPVTSDLMERERNISRLKMIEWHQQQIKKLQES